MQVGGEILHRIEQTRPRFILLQFGAVDLHLTYLWFVFLLLYLSPLWWFLTNLFLRMQAVESSRCSSSSSKWIRQSSCDGFLFVSLGSDYSACTIDGYEGLCRRSITTSRRRSLWAAVSSLEARAKLSTHSIWQISNPALRNTSKWVLPFQLSLLTSTHPDIYRNPLLSPLSLHFRALPTHTISSLAEPWSNCTISSCLSSVLETLHVSRSSISTNT